MAPRPVQVLTAWSGSWKKQLSKSIPVSAHPTISPSPGSRTLPTLVQENEDIVQDFVQSKCDRAERMLSILQSGWAGQTGRCYTLESAVPHPVVRRFLGLDDAGGVLVVEVELRTHFDVGHQVLVEQEVDHCVGSRRSTVHGQLPERRPARHSLAPADVGLTQVVLQPRKVKHPLMAAHRMSVSDSA
eukprot:2584254-Rhodomonas_salina.2